MERHIDFTETVNSIAKAHWGRDFTGIEEASKGLLEDNSKLTAFALVELLRRLNAVARAIGESSSSVKEEIAIPSNAVPFPDKRVGDKLFHGDLEDGFTEYVIVSKNDNGICMIVSLDHFDLHHPSCAMIACNYHYQTIEDAIEEIAIIDQEYHGARLKRAEEALAAVKKKEDLSRFVDGL